MFVSELLVIKKKKTAAVNSLEGPPVKLQFNTRKYNPHKSLLPNC